MGHQLLDPGAMLMIVMTFQELQCQDPSSKAQTPAPLRLQHFHFQILFSLSVFDIAVPLALLIAFLIEPHPDFSAWWAPAGPTSICFCSTPFPPRPIRQLLALSVAPHSFSHCSGHLFHYPGREGHIQIHVLQLLTCNFSKILCLSCASGKAFISREVSISLDSKECAQSCL